MLFCVLLVVAARGDSAAQANAEHKVDLKEFRVIKRESGPVNYYTLHEEGPRPFIRGTYRPPDETTVLGYEIPEALRRSVATVRWSWRALVLPQGGDECTSGKTDSAAVVYITWKRALKWYTVKYVWSAVGHKGAICDKSRGLFSSQDTVIVESGPPLDEWRTVTISPDVEFRNHFEGGNPHASVPKLVGIGIMVDGDQTKSASEADFADFTLVPAR
jgi:hypothetical protein